MKPTLLILAAGMGSRYGGLKQVDPIGPSGEAIIDYSIYDAIRAGFGKIVFVIRKSFADNFIEVFTEKLKDRIETEFVFQELDNIPAGIEIGKDRQKPWGTGHAVLVAKEKIHEPFVVINADDYYGVQSYKIVGDYLRETYHKNQKDHYSMVGYELSKTLSDFGHVSRGVCQTNNHDSLMSVVERTQIEREGDNIWFMENGEKKSISGGEVVSMNLWGFHPSFFSYLDQYFTRFIQKNSSNPTAEFYIPFVVNELINSNSIDLKVLKSEDKWFGITYKEDRPIALEKIRKLIDLGVYPNDLWIK